MTDTNKLPNQTEQGSRKVNTHSSDNYKRGLQEKPKQNIECEKRKTNVI